MISMLLQFFAREFEHVTLYSSSYKSKRDLSLDYETLKQMVPSSFKIPWMLNSKATE